MFGPGHTMLPAIDPELLEPDGVEPPSGTQLPLESR